MSDGGSHARGPIPKRKLIQMVFQDPSSSLDPQRTAFEAIADPLMRLEA
jgi:peptide/nickel transport system ATP-binding protein